jgi:hypothetical protein
MQAARGLAPQPDAHGFYSRQPPPLSLVFDSVQQEVKLVKKRIETDPSDQARQVPAPVRKSDPARRSSANTKHLLEERDLSEEIAMLRRALRRFFQLAMGCEDVETAATTLSVIGLAAIRISRLLLAQKELGGANDPLMEAIQNAVLETAREMTSMMDSA